MEKQNSYNSTAASNRAMLPGVGQLVSDGLRYMLKRWDIVLGYVLSMVIAIGAGLVFFGLAFVSGSSPVIAGFFLAVGSLVGVTLLAIFGLAVTYAATKQESISFWASVRYAVKHFWPLFWVMLLTSLVTIAGFVFLLIPGIILAVYLYFAQLAILHHGYRGMEALRYSTYLVKNNWWGVFGRIIAVALVYGIIFGLIQVVVDAIFGKDLGSLIGGVISMFGSIFVLRTMGDMYHSLVAQKTEYVTGWSLMPANLYSAIAWIGVVIVVVLPALFGFWLVTEWTTISEVLSEGVEGPDMEEQTLTDGEIEALLENYESQIQMEIDAVQ